MLSVGETPNEEKKLALIPLHIFQAVSYTSINDITNEKEL